MKITYTLSDIEKRAIKLFALLCASMIAINFLRPIFEVSKKKCALVLLIYFFGCATVFLYSVIRNKIKEKYHLYVKAATVILSAAILSVGVNLVYCMVFSIGFLAASSLVRIVLFTVFFSFVICFTLFDTKSVLDFIHNKRWAIALLIFLMFFALKLNFSNGACFNYHVQPDIGTAYSVPVFGVVRDIRSDEWLVDLPRRASAEYSGYGLINDIVRGTANYNISSSYLYMSYSALANPLNFGYFLFGTEYGTSFHWSGLFILSIMVAYEFSLLITGGQRGVSVFGMAILGLSSFALWWSINVHILAMAAVIVAANGFFKSDKLYARILFAIGVAVSAACFICTVYPAWQVPAAYILLAVFAWVIVSNFDRVKAMKWKDWTVFGAAFLFMCSIVLAYLVDTAPYNSEIMNTVYPGSRFDNGSNAFYKGSWYIQSLLYPFNNTGNNSEAGAFFNLFPLPMILATVIVIWQLVRRIVRKEGRVDLLLLLLLVPTAMITLYCTKGYPAWLAKITLMNYSIPSRAVDFLGLANCYILLRLLSYGDEEKLNIPVWAGIGAGVCLVFYNIKNTEKFYPEYMTSWYVVIISMVIVSVAVVLLCKMSAKNRGSIIAIASMLVIVSGVLVLPITRGLDSLLHKPASYEVQRIVEEDPDAKWIGYDTIIFPQFLIANGAPTINSINYLPNMELWTELDPEGVYNEVYNRYSHVSCVFTEDQTSFTLVQQDLMILRLNYADIEKTGVKYVFSPYGIGENTDILDLKLIYNESNVFIYEIVYN